MAAALLALALLLAQEPSFAYERWGAWHSFGEGSSVTVESTVAGRPVKTTITLAKRGGKEITLRTVDDLGANRSRPESTFEKAYSRKEIPRYVDAVCPRCRKHKLGEAIQSRVKLKIGGRELDCVLEQIRWLNCGGVSSTTREWYCTQIPGWIARSETEGQGDLTRAVCAFEAKAPPAGEVEVEPYDALVFRRRSCEDPDVLRLAKTCTGLVGEIAGVVEAREGGLEYQYNLIHLLAHVRSDDALRALQKFIDQGATVNIKGDAMSVIGHFDRDDVRQYLIGKLGTRGTNMRELADALVQAKARTAIAPLLKLVERGDRDEISSAARALGELGDPGTGESLAALYPKLKWDTERVEVACAAAKLGVKRMEPEIRKLMKSSVSYVRTGAADYVLAQGDLAGLDLYLAELKDDRDRAAWYSCQSLRERIPELPTVGDPKRMELTAEERRQALAWLTANRAKLVFDPKSRLFRVK